MTMSKRIPELLKNVPLFNALEPVHLEFIASSCEVLKFERGASIFCRGDPIHYFYYLLTGSVKLYAMSRDGAEKVIHIAKPGETFGEAALFLDAPAPVGTEAIQESMVLALPKTTLYKLIEQNSRIAYLMLAGMSMRMHRLIQEIKGVALQSTSERIIAYLLQLCSEQHDTQKIKLPAKKSTIASLLNLTPETLSRTQTKLENQGLIEVNATEIHIPDSERLRATKLI